MEAGAESIKAFRLDDEAARDMRNCSFPCVTVVIDLLLATTHVHRGYCIGWGLCVFNKLVQGQQLLLRFYGLHNHIVATTKVCRGHSREEKLAEATVHTMMSLNVVFGKRTCM